MFNIKEFFKKTQNRQIDLFTLYSTIKKTIDINVDDNIPIQNIIIQKNSSIIRLKNTNSSLKNQIFLKKQKILEDLNKTQKTLRITDIT